MSSEKLTEGWISALKLYESVKTVSVSNHKYTNGRERNTFISKEFGFRVSWPNGWAAESRLSEFYKRQSGFGSSVIMPIVIVPESLCGGFRPSVTVAMENSVGIDIESYLRERIQISKGALVEIVRSIGVDLVSILQFRYLSPLGIPSEERIFQIQKIALTNNRVYIITASQIPESELKRNDRLKGDLDKIMSSFAFVT
ncbi:MAG: hypothetical protein C4291_12575 [Candidatus Dadabacteria bacterium]